MTPLPGSRTVTAVGAAEGQPAREEMQTGIRELLSQLDGSIAARVAMLAGMTREELEAVGGVEEGDKQLKYDI